MKGILVAIGILISVLAYFGGALAFSAWLSGLWVDPFSVKRIAIFAGSWMFLALLPIAVCVGYGATD